jgi:hypothetical protein
MGLLTKIFGGKKAAGENSQSRKDDRNPIYEQKLKTDFCLEYQKEDWVFKGGKLVDLKLPQLSDPTFCWETAKSIAKKGDINQMCIIPSNRTTLFIFPMKPPMCFVTGLNASGIASLIASAIKETGNKVFSYHGTWLVTI